MFEPTRRLEEPVAALPRRMLAMAILAPFGVIALMASPLLIDALRHVVGS
jgi:hypothetical protein